MELSGQVIGFTNSGCAYEVVMSDEAFKELVGHDPAAPNVVIMSVVIDAVGHQCLRAVKPVLGGHLSKHNPQRVM